ncbi:hypothetical protein Y032_0025g1188 [Ancylostoma ceylanicum]|uniref:Uncharacterized protein n=1 Tax=Ancylostoma ceylanicum TaxID=53326 RepID=A0A016UXD8_9BILA|nr:hypothetical protein Y032_0025g1188 [Ancylostoma ceylanicum]
MRRVGSDFLKLVGQQVKLRTRPGKAPTSSTSSHYLHSRCWISLIAFNIKQYYLPQAQARTAILIPIRLGKPLIKMHHDELQICRRILWENTFKMRNEQ